MIERNFIEIQGTFLIKLRDNAFNWAIEENVFEHINKFLKIKEDNDPNDIADIFKIEGNLFDFETPSCEAFNDFNYLFKTDKDLFTFDIQGTRTYEEYELNNPITRDHEEPSDIVGFVMVVSYLGRLGLKSMTYFQDHKWYDELVDGKLKNETLALKAKVEGSWGDAAPEVNTHEITPFTRMENFGRGPYANMKTKKTRDPYLDVNRVFSEASNVGKTQENQGHKNNPTPEPSNYKIKRFEMMKYSFNGDEKFITLKESEYLNHLKDSLVAYQELLRLIDEGWVVTTSDT
nr:hypothetical protein [Tanacetum cinerariifolium]